MKNKILIVSPDNNWGQNMSTTLAQEQINTSIIVSLENLEESLASGDYIAMLIDIDLLPINNRMIRQLTLKYPGVSFLCVSAYRFHPDLRDALCYHIYACIQKPVDMCELLFFVNSIYKDSSFSVG